MTREPVSAAAPPEPHSPLRAWAELTRISNLPTVLTNVLAGAIFATSGGAFPPVTALLIAALSAALFYAAGMALNDWCDRGVDAVERPHRPLPSGRVSAAAALTFAVVAMGCGLGLALLASPAAAGVGAVLAAAIIAYNLTHRLFAGSVILLGACRGLVYILAAECVAGFSAVLLWPAGLMFAYVVLLSIAARGEAGASRPPAVLGVVMLLLPTPGVLAAAASPLVTPVKLAVTLGFYALFAAWVLRGVAFIRATPSRTVPAILTWLSGICLLDAYVLADRAIGVPVAAFAAVGCWAVTVYAHRRILGS